MLRSSPGRQKSSRRRCNIAGDWIKIEHTTPDKPEVWRIAKALGKTPEDVFGRLVRLWIWADQQSLDGTDLPITEGIIDAWAKHDGFARAMREVGWLDGEDGCLTFPNFERHNGTTAKRRSDDARRKASSRKGKPRPQNVRKMSAKCHKKNGQNAELEKRREENNKDNTSRTEPRPLPDEEIPFDDPPKNVLTLKVPSQPRPRDELFDAVAEVTGAAPKASASHVAKVCKLLRAESPPFTPEEVRRFGRECCGWLQGDKPSLGYLEKNIGKVRRLPATVPKAPAGNEWTVEMERAHQAQMERERAEYMRTAQNGRAAS